MLQAEKPDALCGVWFQQPRQVFFEWLLLYTLSFHLTSLVSGSTRGAHRTLCLYPTMCIVCCIPATEPEGRKQVGDCACAMAEILRTGSRPGDKF